MTFGNALRFSAYAYAKLLWMRNRGSTEVAGYCITGTEDPLLVTDFALIKQKCTSVSFDMDPEDLADFGERMVDAGLASWQCLNILAHSHPANCPQPSPTDENNFRNAFSHPHWAVMFIIANGGATYCRLKVNIGPGIIKELPIEIDWSEPFQGSNKEEWEKEYKDKVTEIEFCSAFNKPLVNRGTQFLDDDDNWLDYYMENRESVPSDSLDIISCHSDNDNNDYLYDDNDYDCYWLADGDAECWNPEDNFWYSYNPITKTWFKDGMPVNKPTARITRIMETWAADNADERLDIMRAAQ